MWGYTIAMAAAWFLGSDQRRSSLLDALGRGVLPAVASGVAGRWVARQLAFDSIGMAVSTAVVTAIVVVVVYGAMARLFRFAEANPREWRRKTLDPA
jgi:hypothetical protein